MVRCHQTGWTAQRPTDAIGQVVTLKQNESEIDLVCVSLPDYRWDEQRGCCLFAYDAEGLKTGYEVSALSCTLDESSQINLAMVLLGIYLSRGKM